MVGMPALERLALPVTEQDDSEPAFAQVQLKLSSAQQTAGLRDFVCPSVTRFWYNFSSSCRSDGMQHDIDINISWWCSLLAIAVVNTPLAF